MKNVIFTIAAVSIILNVGLITKYVRIGAADLCVPTMNLGDIAE